MIISDGSHSLVDSKDVYIHYHEPNISSLNFTFSLPFYLHLEKIL